MNYAFAFWFLLSVWLLTVGGLVRCLGLIDWYRRAWIRALRKNKTFRSGPSSISELTGR